MEGRSKKGSRGRSMMLHYDIDDNDDDLAMNVFARDEAMIFGFRCWLVKAFGGNNRIR